MSVTDVIRWSMVEGSRWCNVFIFITI